MDDELEAIRERLRKDIIANVRPTGPVELSDAAFDMFVARHRTVLVDVWAEWCGPCRRMSPLVEELGHEWKGRVAVAKLDADQAPMVTERYRVQSIPTFLWFHQGALVGRLVGVQPRAAFEAALAEIEG